MQLTWAVGATEAIKELPTDPYRLPLRQVQLCTSTARLAVTQNFSQSLSMPLIPGPGPVRVGFLRVPPAVQKHAH